MKNRNGFLEIKGYCKPKTPTLIDVYATKDPNLKEVVLSLRGGIGQFIVMANFLLMDIHGVEFCFRFLKDSHAVDAYESVHEFLNNNR